MKHLFSIITMLVPVFTLAQDVILLKSEDRIEDIKITNVSDTSIVYLSNKTEHTLATKDVSAYLMNGKYVEITIKQNNETENPISDNTYEPTQNVSNKSKSEEQLIDIDESTIKQFKQDLNRYLNGDKAHYALYKESSANIKKLKSAGMYESAYTQAVNTYKEVKDNTDNGNEAVEAYFMILNESTNNISTSSDINNNAGNTGNSSAKTNVFGYEGYQSNDVKLGIKFKWDASIYLLKGNIDRVKEYDQVRKESNSTGYDNGALQEGLRVYSEMKQAKASSVECIDAYINAYISTFRNQQPMNGIPKSDNW